MRNKASAKNRLFFSVFLFAFFLVGCAHITSVLSPQTTSTPAIETPKTTDKPHQVSLEALMEKEYDGKNLALISVLSETDAYTRYTITYEGDGLTISGIMNIPKGNGPFPVLILNHGYIDPDIYTNGRGLKREQDYFAQRGFAVLHPDYRNHAFSDKDPDNKSMLRTGYTIDVINAVVAVKNSSIPSLDTNNIGMLGHSMGGGITLNTLVVRPELVSAAVLFAPVSADYRKNFNKWTREREDLAQRIIERYGSPTTSPEFWDGISAVNYFDNITAPIQLHHGTEDESVPIEWSEELELWLRQKNKEASYFVYEGEKHEFINQWPLVMRRALEFFEDHLN